METNPAKVYSLAFAARENYISVSSLAVGFKKQFGIPFYRYLRCLRLSLACTLLAETFDPVACIAIKVGFATSCGFNKAFKKRYGMAPLAFRSLYTTWNYENFST